MENKITPPNLQGYKKYICFKKNNKAKFENFLGEVSNYSFKSRKSRSISTNYEDRKDNETKDIISLKNILNHKSFIKDLFNSNNIKERNIMENAGKNINIIKKFDDKISYNINQKVSFKENEKYDIKIKKSFKKLINRGKLNKSPPTIPELFNLYFLTNNKSNNNYYNKKNYKNYKNNKIPNNFYNHLMIKNKKKNNIYFSSYSITKRIKSKLLTIIFYTPVKN